MKRKRVNRVVHTIGEKGDPMKKKAIWLVLSGLIVVALVLGSCQAAAPEEKEKEAVTEEKEAVTEEKEVEEKE